MVDFNKELNPENLTQKDIMTYLLHSTQHTVTREELQDVRNELKVEIQEVRTELKAEIQEVRTELKTEIQEVRTELKTEIQEVRTEIREVKKELTAKIDKVDSKFDRMQWLIIATIATVLLKDYILKLIGS
jgi:chromosome segregation ATPase